jgi:hypothetical protein
MPPPVSAVAEAQASADLYLNRVLRDFRQSAPEHKAWVAAVKAVMQALQALARSHCATSLVWRGTRPASDAPAAPATAPAVAAAAVSTAAAGRASASGARLPACCYMQWP